MQQGSMNEEEFEYFDYEDDNPALSKIIERNIRTIIRLRLQTANERNLQDRIADSITSFSGHIVFVYVHLVWFGAWIVLNTGRMAVHPFDPFPYGLLTMVGKTHLIY